MSLSPLLKQSVLTERHSFPRSFFRVCAAILNGAGPRRIHLMLGMLLKQYFNPIPFHNHRISSVSVSPKGWTDQELGLKWLEQDFEPNTGPETPEDYWLLILDRHNSHCTYPFIKFASEHHIIIMSSLTYHTCITAM